MPSNGTGQRITVYFGERDTWRHHSLALAFLEMLRREGCSGATVTRGVAGFGAGSRIKTATLVELSVDLPMVLTVVDTLERVGELLPKISDMLGGGLITVEEVDIYQYSSRFKETLPDLPVRTVCWWGSSVASISSALAQRWVPAPQGATADRSAHWWAADHGR